MAHTSTINAWMVDLATSLTDPSHTTLRQRPRRNIESFRRRLKHHNYARTNQFDVRDRFDGLEEKFQILNREDLSDALHERRMELRDHYERWIPDVLDLLLRLSNDPIRKTKMNDLSDVVASSVAMPPLLRWSDIEADDPIDRRDLIWQRPNFSDLSSDEEEADVSTATTSPASVKKQRSDAIESDEAQYGSKIIHHIDLEAAEYQLQTLQQTARSVAVPVTEIQLLRQILLLAQGHPSVLFGTRHSQIELDSHVHLSNLNKQTVELLVNELGPMIENLSVLSMWLGESTPVDYIQKIKQSIEVITHNFRSSISVLEEQMIHPRSLQTASLLSTVTQIKQISIPIAVLTELINQVKHTDSVSCLDALYDIVYKHYFENNATGLGIMLPIFLEAFDVYMKPIAAWLENGSCTSKLEPFFITSKSDSKSASSLWHDWFELGLSGRYRPPQFLLEYAQSIFACGKTVAFINYIDSTQRESGNKVETGFPKHDLRALFTDPMIPFPAGLSDILQNYFSTLLASKTTMLRNLLESSCGLTRTLDTFEFIYLRKDGSLLDTFESRIFNRVDACKDNWNDRFLVADMLEDAYSNTKCIDLSSISILSVSESSRSMEHHRRSVQILASLAIDYTLPWPIANIISKPSMAAYRRVALHNIQIRRAKYVLERTAFHQAHSSPISNNPRDQHLAQTTTFMLLHFVNTLYDHFTTGVALPLTTRMRRDLIVARDVDAMIAVHASYIANMEYACLTAKQLKVLRETLISLLDTCIRFADLLSSFATREDTVSAARHRKGSEEFEAASFFSARSQWKKRRQRRRHRHDPEGRYEDEDEDDEDEDDDEFGDDGAEGYSSFIVLEKDTSVGEEIRKLQVQFRRQLDFFVAGLRGVGRGSGTAVVVDEFEILADRLDWRSN